MKVRILRGQWAGETGELLEVVGNYARMSLRGNWVSVHREDCENGATLKSPEIVPMPAHVKQKLEALGRKMTQ